MLAKILGHADLSLLMRYVHPSQADMDRAMEWYSSRQGQGVELEKNAVGEFWWDKPDRGLAWANFRAKYASKTGPNWPNPAKVARAENLVIGSTNDLCFQ
jgi:hypothetical protein